jgi:hypothetical protein
MKDYSLFVIISYIITLFIMLIMLAKSVIKYYHLEKKYYQKLYGKEEKGETQDKT